MGDWQQRLDQIIDARFDEIVRLRRHLHMYPEVSQQEHQTSATLYQLLDDDFQLRIGPEGCGVIVDMIDAPEAPCIALRGDIDALTIHDQKVAPYRSQHDGIMHACGHDAHSATVVGALWALRQLVQEDLLPWPVRFRGILQPAEETSTGAVAMVQSGAIEGVQAIVAAHVDPTRQVGAIGIREGVMTANCDAVSFHIQGRGGHAARPHEANDPIAACAQLINSLYLHIPRATDSQDAVVVTIGQIVGGDIANVIPESVELHGTLRTLETEIRRRATEQIRQIAQGIGISTGTEVSVEFNQSCGSVRNDPLLTRLISESAERVIGAEQVQMIPRPSMGSEDFASYMDHIPGAMFRLGCASESAGSSPLHSPTFDIDEQALAIGARIMVRTVVHWSNPDAPRPTSTL